MTWLQALVLGLIQGITEFLPISSSAHLVLTPHLMGWHDQGITFDIVANAGTLLAVMLYFRRELWAMLVEPWSRPAAVASAGSGPVDDPGADDHDEDDHDADTGRENGSGDAPADPAPLAPAERARPPMLALLALGSVPVVVTGLVAYSWISTSGRSAGVVATTSILFGLLLYWADRTGSQTRTEASLGWRDAWIVGLAQALALVPGTSRSGITITAALWLGLRREDAARFSFLLSVPVGLAALVHDLRDLAGVLAGGGGADLGLVPIAVGFVASMVSAYAVIGWLLAWVQKQDLKVFVVYRIALGLVLLGLIWIP